MMNTLKHTFHSIGDRSGELARAFGSETTHLAKRVGNETAYLAKRIGPRRGLIGLAMLAATIGGSIMLVRYLRARNLERARRAYQTGDQASAGHGMRAQERSRAQRTGDVQPSR
jgi:hypothetical protein